MKKAYIKPEMQVYSYVKQGILSGSLGLHDGGADGSTTINNEDQFLGKEERGWGSAW